MEALVRLLLLVIFAAGSVWLVGLLWPFLAAWVVIAIIAAMIRSAGRALAGISPRRGHTPAPARATAQVYSLDHARRLKKGIDA